MAKKCARTFSIVVEKGKKSILDVGHLLPVGIARYVCLGPAARESGRKVYTNCMGKASRGAA